MKKALLALALMAFVASCATEQKDYSRDQEKAREHGQEAFQAPEVNE
jgi:hypothetical protein